MPTGPAESPAIAVHSLAVFDPDELVEAVGSSILAHSQLSGGAFRGELFAMQLANCRLDSGRYNQTLISRGAFPSDQLVIGCLLDAGTAGCLNGYRFGRHDCVVFPAGAELDYLVPADTHWVALQVPQASIEAYGLDRIAAQGLQVISGSHGTGARFVAQTKGVLDAITAGAGEPAEVTQSGANWLESRLLDTVCCLLSENLAGADARPHHAARMALVRAFERLVEDNAYRNLRIAQIAMRLNVGQRTLESCFKDLLGMSPMQYLIRLRLNAIHHALMRYSVDSATVETIARQHGVNHLGRFSAYYRDQFGCNPQATLRRRFR
jgi:AraC-like DNA-binding protein